MEEDKERDKVAVVGVVVGGVGRVFRSTLLLKHVLSFISIINKELQLSTTKYKYFTSDSISHLRYCHHEDLLFVSSLDKSLTKRHQQQLQLQQKQKAFKLLVSKLQDNINNNNNNYNQFIIYFQGLPTILKNCKDVFILKQIHQLYPHYFYQHDNDDDDKDGLSKKNGWIVDNIAASGSFACLLYAIETLKSKPSTKTLEMASEYGHTNLFAYLCETYPELGIGRSFDVAASYPHMTILKYILENRTECCYTVSTLASIAATDGIEEAKLLLAHKNKRLLKSKDNRFYHFADFSVVRGHLDMVKLFYSHFGQDRFLNRAIDQAAELGYLDIVIYLKETVKLVESQDSINYSAKNGHVHVVRYLCEINKKRELGFNLGDAINKAAAEGQLAVVEYLCGIGAECDKKMSMHYASINGHLEVVQFIDRHYQGGECKSDTISDICRIGKGDYLAMFKYMIQKYPCKGHDAQQVILSSAAQRGCVSLYKAILKHLEIDLDDPLTWSNHQGSSHPIPFWSHIAPPHVKLDLSFWLIKKFSHLMAPSYYTQFLSFSSPSYQYPLDIIEYIYCKCPEVFNYSTSQILLNKACIRNNVDLLAFFHKNGLPAPSRDVLNVACSSASLECIKFIYENYGHIEHLRFNSALLEHACRTTEESLEMIQYLSTIIKLKKQPLHRILQNAIGKKNEEMVQFIYNNNVDKIKKLYSQPTTAPTNQFGNQTLLKVIKATGNVRIMEFFFLNMPTLSIIEEK
ncbi:hypothetical protein DFA_09093 [Cavenderia fasciculata]|uniref:Ankyrin repeat-containing protein n=1 Tax=Cavenderia fasciculata TaxID=261658 RepID=F4Q6N9_CACFS|nr:uncharacterized protein DFA_09093 [Cavenderia fasciculata]EGG16549.1 hypothetical protein DFA_09093 [Cavenderia fasciculata]|eukprot:XP_004354949.1 hypothetical protein DFA_09093 [Cavenderia fasciculata]